MPWALENYCGSERHAPTGFRVRSVHIACRSFGYGEYLEPQSGLPADEEAVDGHPAEVWRPP